MEPPRLPRGIRNNNPLNLRKTTTPWLGKVYPGTDSQFEQFTSMAYGIRAAMKNAKSIIKRHRGCTIRKLIEIWAPPIENHTDIYIHYVCHYTDFRSSDPVDPTNKEQFCKIIWAMAQVENGMRLELQPFLDAYSML